MAVGRVAVFIAVGGGVAEADNSLPTPAAWPQATSRAITSNKMMPDSVAGWGQPAGRPHRCQGSITLANFFHFGDSAKGRARNTIDVNDAVRDRIVRRAAALIAKVKVEEESQPDVA